jgi:hypothetical protein
MSDHFDSDLAWAVELLQEWGAEQTAGVGRGCVWADSGYEDGDEMRELKTALERLAREHPAEHAAIVAEFAAVRRGHQLQARLLLPAITRLALWVDEAMD